MVKIISSQSLIYSFSPDNRFVEKVSPGEIVVFETIDALGGQIKDEATPLTSIDWSRVNPATGPVYVENAEPGDTLVVDVLDIEVGDRAIIVTVPGSGVLGFRDIKPKAKILPIVKGLLHLSLIHI